MWSPLSVTKKAEMGFVLLMWVVIPVLCVVQGIYVLRTGQTDPFLLNREHRHAAATLAKRLEYAGVYLGIGAGLIAFLIVEFRRTGGGPARAWLHENSGMLFWDLFIIAGGVLHLAQPAKMLRWTIRTHPELADHHSVVLVTRVIGLLLLALGLVILAKL